MCFLWTELALLMSSWFESIVPDRRQISNRTGVFLFVTLCGFIWLFRRNPLVASFNLLLWRWTQQVAPKLLVPIFQTTCHHTVLVMLSNLRCPDFMYYLTCSDQSIPGSFMMTAELAYHAGTSNMLASYSSHYSRTTDSAATHETFWCGQLQKVGF